MRTLCGLILGLLLVSGLFAQRTGGSAPYTVGGPGNVVYPAGTPATNPYITRVPANVVYPGGGGPHLVTPGTTPRAQRNNGGGYVYAYPVYVPSYDPSMVPAAPAQSAPAQPNVIVVYPQGAGAPMQQEAPPQMRIYTPDALQPATPMTSQETQESQVEHYLLAFKDHSIYSAVAYWVDGDTLHYFTSGNVHHQSPLTQVDRDMTDRLNKESGTPLKLPAAK
jgi:hypothetical protein